MNKKELLEQLESLEENQRDFISHDDTGVFERDCMALQLAYSIIKEIDLNELNNRADQMLIQDVSQKLTYDNKLVVMQYYYETAEVEEKKKVITKKIQKLQMEIDKVMLNTEIDIDNILNLNFTDLEKVFG